MKRNISTTQTGYALILMVLTLMGIGGVLLTGFTQDVKRQSEHQRYLHNQRVLKEAKQALLQYAYNYPVTAGNGPGRLPCPDTNNDGIPNASAFCINGAPMVGRFPWKEPEMNFYDARDASGARLWYAVSSTFANSGGGIVINSDTVGQITIQDQSGAVMYDGTATGVAAVIIAPGLPIDRGGVAQDRPADVDDPVNYLDLFGAVDNADFVNNSANGFIMGPIDNLANGIILVNDQLIVVTTAEVIAMAEKAVLAAYRDTIEGYLDKVACTGESPEGTGTTEALCLANGGVWDPVYPWLYNYADVTDLAALSSYYPANTTFGTELADNLGNVGRIPSIFADYFTETASQPIETALSGSLGITFPVLGLTYTQLTKEFLIPVPDVQPPAEFQFNDYPTPPFRATKISDVSFVNLATAGEGRLSANFAEAEPPITLDMYFWDDDEGPPTGVWTACVDDGDNIAELSDCHRGSGGAHINNMEILHVVVTLDFPVTPGVVNYDMNYSTPPTFLVVPATSGSHARIMATFDRDDIINGTMPTISGGTYEYDPHYHPGFALGEQNDATFRAGSVDTTDFSLDELTLSIRYYPELPGWAFGNGWHNSIMMAYADDYRPDGAGGPCTVGTNCLVIDKFTGARNNKVSLLVIAGEHDWADGGDGSMSDDVGDVFDVENDDLDSTFDVRAADGNDKILVIDEI
jgi:hypothetical protein